MKYAYQLQAYFRAGLQLVGQEEGELQWIGTSKQWSDAQREIDNYETFNNE